MPRPRSKAASGTTRRQDASDPTLPKYSIAVASNLSGVPQQQLRRMEDGGLVMPERTEGNTRRYSDRDLVHIAEAAALSDEGMNFTGIRTVLDLRAQLHALQAENADLRRQLAAAHEDLAAFRGERVQGIGDSEASPPGGGEDAQNTGR